MGVDLARNGLKAHSELIRIYLSKHRDIISLLSILGEGLNLLVNIF